MHIAAKTALLSLAAAASIVGCGRCGGTTASTSADPSASASADPAPSAAAAPGIDIPEIRDTGTGRATAALRAVLQAHGIAFDAATLERECKVDEDGASIDDLEDVADKYGLDVKQVIVPREHALAPEAKLIPAIVIVDGADESQEFIVISRLDGDRVEIMSPIEGRQWIPRAELEKSLYVHQMSIPVDDWRKAAESPPFQDTLRARMAALGLERPAAQALVDRALADPGWRGFGALDAAIRQREADPGAQLTASFDCAFEARCAAGVPPIAAGLWSVQAAPKGPEGEPQVEVRGAVMLAIAGRLSP